MYLWRGLAIWLLTVSTVAAQFDVPGLNTGFRRRAVRARLVLSHEAAKPGDTVMLLVRHRGVTRFVAVTVEKG